jgi:hypothetical protein
MHCGTQIQQTAPTQSSFMAQPYQQSSTNDPAYSGYAPHSDYAPNSGYMPNPGYAPNPSYAPAPAKVSMNPAKKKKLILFGSIGGAVALLAIILIVVLVINSKGFSSATSAAEALITAEVTRNTKDYVNCLPDFYVCYTGNRYGMGENIPRDVLIDIMPELWKIYSDKPAGKCEIVSSYISDYADESTYHEVITQRRGLFSFITSEEAASIREIVRVTVIYTQNGSRYTEIVTCVNMNGRWYAFP